MSRATYKVFIQGRFLKYVKQNVYCKMSMFNYQKNVMSHFFSYCSPDPTRLLLTFNASTSMVDKFHRNTALHWACMSGNHIAVRLLVEVGANVDVPNDKVD